MQNYLVTFQRAPSDRRGLGVHARTHGWENAHLLKKKSPKEKGRQIGNGECHH